MPKDNGSAVNAMSEAASQANASRLIDWMSAASSIRANSHRATAISRNSTAKASSSSRISASRGRSA